MRIFKKVIAFIIKYIVLAIMICFIIPWGLLGVMWGLISYTFMEGVDLVDEQLDNAGK